MYALFAGLMYYPEGGWGDHRVTLTDLEKVRLQATLIAEEVDWWHIINLENGHVVEKWATDIYHHSKGPLADA